MSTYKINVNQSAEQFINLLPTEVEIDLDGQEQEFNFGCLGYQTVHLYGVEVNLREEVENFFHSMDYTLDSVEVKFSVENLLDACQEQTGLSNAETAAQIISEVMEWLEAEEDTSALIKKNNDLQIENARLRAVLKAAALAD